MKQAADERRAGASMVMPALVVLGAVAGFPLAASLWTSLRRVILVFHEDRFVGLDNFAFMARDARFWGALANTLVFAAIAVTLEIALGLGFACLMHERARGRGLLRAAVLVPWAIPTVVAAKSWAWLLDPHHGLLPRLFASPGSAWLAEPALAMGCAIAVDVWKTTPFVALLLLAGLQSIPEDVYRAARIDGASPLRTFRSITLPLLRPALSVALVFRSLDALRVFDAVSVLTDGGPANTTETLSIYAHKTLTRAGNFGYGSALGVATFALVAVAAALLLRLSRPERGGA